MKKLVFIDVDDTLLTPPYDAVRRVGRLFGKAFPTEQAFIDRTHLHFYEAFPQIFRSPTEMWAIVLLALPFGYFKSQKPLSFDIKAMSAHLSDHRVYLISKNPPSFTRWRVKRIEALFTTRIGDRYVACGPMFKSGASKLQIIESIAKSRHVSLSDCLLIDDSPDNIAAVATAGVATALIDSTWNASVELAPGKNSAKSVRIKTSDMPGAIAEHLQSATEIDSEDFYVIPPLGVISAIKTAWRFIKRAWLYNRRLPRPSQVVAAARNPWASFLYTRPHKAVCDKMQRILVAPHSSGRARVICASRGHFSSLLPLSHGQHTAALSASDMVRMLRTQAREHLLACGEHLLRKNLYFFDGYPRASEIKRLVGSERVRKAIEAFSATHSLAPEAARSKAVAYADQITGNKAYLGCVLVQRFLNYVSTKIFASMSISVHPKITEIEDDTFMVYASTHRSYLDGGLLFIAIAAHARSFPFVVAADKMRFVWIGRLGARAGAFFLQRKFVDIIYAAILEEHLAAMQAKGSSIQIFMEGQRSRSGLTLPPKKGIASMIWQNMDEARPNNCKVALVPVSFAYNKLPESELIVAESFEERRKAGTASLREIADMKIKKRIRKTLRQKFRGALRRLLSAPVSECYINFAEPIMLDRPRASTPAEDKKLLQAALNTAMCSINAQTLALPSSLLCFAVLSIPEHHISKASAVTFLRLSADFLGLYQGHSQSPSLASGTEEANFNEFLKLPFINRKFKKHKIAETDVACISGLDTQRSLYYRNNVFHFFVLPAIIAFVVVESKSGRTDEIHRFLDHLLDKVQKTYFVPAIGSSETFIDSFLQILSRFQLLTVQDRRYDVATDHAELALLEALAAVGGQLLTSEFSADLADFKRTYKRLEVDAPIELVSLSRSIDSAAEVLSACKESFYVKCSTPPIAGDTVSFSPHQTNTPALQGIAAEPDPDGATIRRAAGLTSQSHPEVVIPANDTPRSSATGALIYTRTIQVSGLLANLSPTGAFIKTDVAFEKGDRLFCSIVTDGKILPIEGVVTRVADAGIGLHFQNMTPVGQARLLLLYHEST